VKAHKIVTRIVVGSVRDLFARIVSAGETICVHVKAVAGANQAPYKNYKLLCYYDKN
jgi:hypothetical protein